MVLLRDARAQTDAELVQLCQNGDDSAFDELVRRYKQRVYNLLYRFLGNQEDALDLSQEVFVRAYRSIGRFQGASKLSTWLFAIAANLARNRFRDQSRKGRNQGESLEALQEAAPALAEQASAVDDGGPRRAAQERELAEGLQACLNTLPAPLRLTFVLRAVEELSYDEIARAMECPVGTVKSRLNHARRELYERLRAMEML